MTVYGHSYWAPAAPAARVRGGALKGSLTADVVVIGGGFTGCAAAYALADAGLDVILLDASRLASGSTEGSIGAILPVPDLPLIETEKTAGKREARMAFTELRRSAADVDFLYGFDPRTVRRDRPDSPGP